MLCEQCKSKVPTLTTRLARVNSALAQLGYTYHETIPFEDINDILEDNGFERSAFSGWANNSNRTHESVGENKWLSVSVHRMEYSGRWEVVAYVN